MVAAGIDKADMQVQKYFRVIFSNIYLLDLETSPPATPVPLVELR